MDKKEIFKIILIISPTLIFLGFVALRNSLKPSICLEAPCGQIEIEGKVIKNLDFYKQLANTLINNFDLMEAETGNIGNDDQYLSRNQLRRVLKKTSHQKTQCIDCTTIHNVSVSKNSYIKFKIAQYQGYITFINHYLIFCHDEFEVDRAFDKENSSISYKPHEIEPAWYYVIIKEN